MVSAPSVAFMGVTLLFVIAAAVIMPVYIKKKYHTAIVPYFIGCGVFFLFALTLEQLVHLVVLKATGDAITGNMWLLALYGGFAAGIFEETGRFLAMKFVMKKQHHDPHNALMYGAGHGCGEAVMLIGMGMISNIAYSLMINGGQTDMLLANLPAAQQEQMQAVFTQLKETASYMFLLSGFERITAIMLHIALSVLVWTAVVKKKLYFFPLAILLHAAPDGLLVILQQTGVNNILLEIILLILAAAIAVFAYRIWQKELNHESFAAVQN